MDGIAERDGIFSWRWPGFWSVNLPAVVVLWQVLLARSFVVYPELYQFVAAGALAWLFVSGERWITFIAGHSGDPAVQEAFDESKGAIFRLWGLVGAGLMLVALFRMTYWEILVTVTVIGVAGCYLFALQRWREITLKWLSPELGLAAMATFPAILFVLVNAAFSPHRTLLPLFLLFFLFFYYVAVQFRWTPVALAGEMLPLLHSRIGTLCRGLPVALMLAGGALGLTGKGGPGDLVLIAIAVSAALLVVLEFWERTLGSDQCRRLADIAMLTPLAPLLLGI